MANFAPAPKEPKSAITDAERNRWLLKYLIRHQLLVIEVCQPEAGMAPAPFWVLRAPAIVNRSVVLGYGRSQDDAIDAAMKETPCQEDQR